jgi:hypothetical protein
MLHEEIAIYFRLLRDYVRAMAEKGNGLMGVDPDPTCALSECCSGSVR